MRSKLRLVTTFILLTSAFAQSQKAQIGCEEPAVIKIFSPYPANEALQHIATTHACRSTLNRQHLTFYSTWFLEGNPRVAIQTRIHQSGQASSVRSVYNWAEQASRVNDLTEAQMTSLGKVFEELPESAQSIPLEFLYIASFKHKGEW
ncbi:MAG TPA: hypothetical protein VFR12_09940, partial [Pyrinomonadaceae bacterium]|nr:hypothetical protein [Pyrinomonadaceae bacterium]